MRCVFRLASQPTPTVTPNMIILIRTILIGLQDEIAPIEVKVKKAKVAMEADEHPKPKTTIEGLAKLPAVFKKVFTKLVVIPALESESTMSMISGLITPPPRFRYELIYFGITGAGSMNGVDSIGCVKSE